MTEWNTNFKINMCHIFVCSMIIAYGMYRCKTSSFRDPITQCVLKDNKQLCQFLDGWGFLHFFYFMLLGYLFPHNLQMIFWTGVLWEVVESYSQEHPFYLSECQSLLKTDQDTGWWYGRWQDVVMNTLGMFCGYFLSQRKLI